MERDSHTLSMFEMKGEIKPAGLIYQWGQSHLLVKQEQGKEGPAIQFPGMGLLLSD